MSRIEYTTVSRRDPSGESWWLRRMPSSFAPSRSMAARLAELKKCVRNSTAMPPQQEGAVGTVCKTGRSSEPFCPPIPLGEALPSSSAPDNSTLIPCPSHPKPGLSTRRPGRIAEPRRHKRWDPFGRKRFCPNPTDRPGLWPAAQVMKRRSPGRRFGSLRARTGQWPPKPNPAVEVSNQPPTGPQSNRTAGAWVILPKVPAFRS